MDDFEWTAIVTSVEHEFHTVFEDRVFDNLESLDAVKKFILSDHNCFWYLNLLKIYLNNLIFGLRTSDMKGRKGLSMGQFADWEVGDDYECIKILG